MLSYSANELFQSPVGSIRSPTDQASEASDESDDDLLRVAFYDTVKDDGADSVFPVTWVESRNRMYARDHPDWKYAGSYIDRRPCRDAFLRLVKDSKNLDMIVTRNYTRFNRRIDNALKMIRRLDCPVLFTELDILTEMPEWDECISIVRACEYEWVGTGVS